jgi:RHS repeat-associated protein
MAGLPEVTSSKSPKQHVQSPEVMVMRLPIAWFASLALALALILSPVFTSAAVQDLTIANYTLVSKTRVDRFNHELTYKATLTNRGTTNIAGATARLVKLPDIFIVDGQLSFGRAAAGQTVSSTDTFTLRWPINRAISPKILQKVLRWNITSISNAAPIANAGTDQSVSVGATVILDGSASSDPNGDFLNYSWTLLAKPAGSLAELAVANSTDDIHPSFVADKPGSYTAQLVVNDGVLDSTPDTVVISTLNSPPVANAGTDQTVFVGSTVFLDGSASTDVDGDPLSYLWSFSQIPAGSTATLSNTSAAKPSFQVDKSGSYFAQLIVNDGKVDSSPNNVVISTYNSPPVAHAGDDQTVFVGITVNLDGSGSNDVDGNHLTYRWALLSAPTGSTAALADATAFNPTIKIDKPGSYTIQLIVNDGTVDSPADTVVISTKNSPPVANAGPDQSIFVNTTATLDGSGSSDVDGDPLTYRWALLSKPDGSTAVLADAMLINPALDIDKPGTYTLQLIVNDSTIDSATDTVVLTTQNSRPVANSGADQTAFVNTLITLDGSGSSDADGDSLTYDWSITSFPGTTAPILSDSTAVKPTFTPGPAGDYIAQLIVGDGQLTSAPDTALVKVSVLPPVNQPPSITSTPVTTAMVGAAYSYQVTATDPNAEDVLIYALSTAPTGMTISATGLIQWTPSVAGDFPVTVTVSDGNGGTATHPFTLTVTTTQVTIPDVTGQTQAAATTALTAANLTLGTVTEENSDTVPAGNVISQVPAAGTQAAPGTAVNFVISSGPAGGTLPPNPVTVAPPVDPTVATTIAGSTAFLYTGPNPIQTGVALGSIDPVRASVIRGKMLTKDNQPLSGATITILNHPEFGQTLSRADGMFDMAINGGGYLTINYQKAGYLPTQRQVNAPWQDYAALPDVVLIGLDAQVTAIDFASSIPVQVARGTVQTDADGARQATLLFPAGTQATLSLPDGSTQPLTTLHIRATEYTVGANGPNTMPGELPPSSGYTYAVELSADEAIAAGATRVQFSQPVPFYVENFVGFPVGSLVPTGFYDRIKGQWVASNNGRVIKVLGAINGLADLDLDGNGAADDATALTALGITDAERQRLAELYAPGTELWRVLLPHLTPWDCNWPYGPPPGSEPPGGSGDPKPVPKPDKPPKDPCKTRGSIIGCEPQTLGEVVGMVGTPWSLHYQSDRVPGRQGHNSLPIRLSGAPLPPGLQRIHLEVRVAGRVFEEGFTPAPNLTHTFTWDGKDVYGRTLQGNQPVKVRIGYEYIAQYYATPDTFEASFNRFGTPPIAVARGGSGSGGGGGGGAVVFSRPVARTTTPPIILWQDYETSLGRLALALGGWSLSIHHAYDVSGRTLYLGNGGRRNADAVGGDIITTVAGNGLVRYNGDGGPAIEAGLYNPHGIAVGPDGSLYIAVGHRLPNTDQSDRVLRVTPDGLVNTVAGNGLSLHDGDGGPATQASLHPERLAVGPDGSLYISDSYNNRIRRITPDGFIATVVGTGLAQYSGDGDPATEAALNHPMGIAIGPDGSLYIADSFNQRIRRIGPDGLITTVAGNGLAGYGGDGGPATQATLNNPVGIAIGPDGSLYIADTGNSRIRRIAPDGLITTVAGDGRLGYAASDGVPATEAALNHPMGIAIGPDGSLYIADSFNQRIRRVGPDGFISTVAGNGFSGYNGDGGPAAQTSLSNSPDVAVGSDGHLYIADLDNARIRRVASLFPGVSATDLAIASEDGREVYHFTGSGRHQRTLDALTGAVRYQFGYDSANRLMSVTDADGNLTAIERDGSGNPTAIVAPFGQRTILDVDTDGYLSRVTNPAAESVQLTYNIGVAEGLLSTLTDPRGNMHRYQYDALGRLVRDENPAGGVTTLARTDITDNHYAVAVTTALGRVTTYEVEEIPTGDTRRVRIDPDGARTETLIRNDGSRRVSYPDGMVVDLVDGPDPRFGMQAPIRKSLKISTTGGITYTRTATRTATLSDPNGPLSLTAQNDTVIINGRTYASNYDAATRKFTITTPTGRQSVIILDAKGRVIESAVPGLTPVQLAYDDRGRITSLTHGNRIATLSYNPQGFLSALTDPLARTVDFAHDPAGRITQITRPDDEIARFGYDPSGNMVTITPPDRDEHTFSFTPVDLLQGYEPPAVPGSPTDQQFTYNVDRQLTGTDYAGTQLSLAYDAAGRAQTVTFPEDRVEATYDTASRLDSLATAGGIGLGYDYDGSLLTSSTWSGPVTGTVQRSFDNNLRLTGHTINGANTQTLTYDADGLLSDVGPLNLQRSAQNGLLTGTTLGLVSDTRSFNGFGEWTDYSASVNGTALFSVQYTRDAAGRITALTETLGGATATLAYGYDLVGRLTQVTRNGATIATYTYDANGNRFTHTTSGGTTNGSYDAQDRLTQYGNTTFTYTANGELLTATTGGQTTNYGYDVLGNLRNVTLPVGTQIEYLIDGQNRRIGKKVNGTNVQGFLYQSGLQPIAELDGNNTVISTFVYGSRPNVPDYMVKGGVTYRILADHLGSPRLVVDTFTGSIVQQMAYDEFGNVLIDTNPGFQPFGFAGGLYDRNTKLVRFGARDYDARVGRWTVKDPTGFASEDTNFYAYVSNDPPNATDPSGFQLSPLGKWIEIVRLIFSLGNVDEHSNLPKNPRPVPVEQVPDRPSSGAGGGGSSPPPSTTGGIVSRCGAWLTVVGSRLSSFVPPIPNSVLCEISVEPDPRQCPGKFY